MRKICIAAAVWLLFLACAAPRAEAFRCGSRIVEVGNWMRDVAQKCGEPDWRDVREEERLVTIQGYAYSPTTKSQVRIPVTTVARVVVEEWVYNLGPTKFIRILRFEDNRLVSIDSGDYGS